METISVVAGNHAVSTERNGFVKIPWISRIGYGLADSSCNIVYGMINTLLTLFYTDYVGISFATVGLVMLLSRFFDGSSDVIMGIIVNKTRSRWGVLVPGFFGQHFRMSSLRLHCSQFRRVRIPYSSGICLLPIICVLLYAIPPLTCRSVHCPL